MKQFIFALMVIAVVSPSFAYRPIDIFGEHPVPPITQPEDMDLFEKIIYYQALFLHSTEPYVTSVSILNLNNSYQLSVCWNPLSSIHQKAAKDRHCLPLHNTPLPERSLWWAEKKTQARWQIESLSRAPDAMKLMTFTVAQRILDSRKSESIILTNDVAQSVLLLLAEEFN